MRLPVPRGPIARAFAATALLVTTALPAPSALAAGDPQSMLDAVSTEFIAALGDASASSGHGAQAWGLWRLDPGPRGVDLDEYAKLAHAGGVAPAGWKFDGASWWMEEHGRIMESPRFPVPPGKYIVTGGREATTVLTIHPPDANGDRRWELADGATLGDVTHLGCRSARYTPAASGPACSPAHARPSAFPVAPGAAMPPVPGCEKQDYAVLIVLGVAPKD